MNNKLPRLVLAGFGTAAVAVLSVFLAKDLQRSVQPAGPSYDEPAFQIACGHAGEPRCGSNVSAVRG